MMNWEPHIWNSNMSRLLHIMLVTAGSFMALPSAHAQPKALGASFSFACSGIVYEHYQKSSSSFLEIALKAQTSEMFAGRSQYPGISSSLTWNIVLKEWLSSEGNPIRIFAGPGVIVGYGKDFEETNGLIFGLKGRVGAECSFTRNALISLSLSPILGSHVISYPDHNSMKYYKNGLMYSLIPEISIKYRF